MAVDKLNSLRLRRRSVLAGGAIAAILPYRAGAVAADDQIATVNGRFGFAAPDVPEGFMLDGKPFQVRAGEMHPCRIPRQHWLHRIRMAKAMGLNTIAIYVMWNYHETKPGQFDFATGNRDIPAFIRLCEQEDMLVYLRPGPYVCAEWDLGGLPAWLLADANRRLRQSDDAGYMAAANRYIAEVAKFAKPMMMANGGPIIMVQIENEYASFGKDKTYLPAIRKMWLDAGIRGPFSISDGLRQIQDAGTYLNGAALGLDGDSDIYVAKGIAGDAPVWIGEGYPGWLTHWGEPFAKGDYRAMMKLLMRDRISFNLYVVHGGTNFGWWAGANADANGEKFEPSITSYDYGAPINERGAPTAQYHDLRKTILAASGVTPMAVPETPPAVGFAPVKTRPAGSIWTVQGRTVAQPKPQPMEIALNQTEGLVLYRATVPAGWSGDLTIDGLHDEALVRLDGVTLGSLSRVKAAGAPPSLPVPPAASPRKLEVLVFPFGRINYGKYMIDRKGIVGAVKIGGREVTDWQLTGLPLDAAQLAEARKGAKAGKGLLHEAAFTLKQVGDTFIDMTGWGLGTVWVNGHLLGRHCRLGPQTRLYCPAEWLRQGRNEIVILDLYAASGLSVRGWPAHEQEK